MTVRVRYFASIREALGPHESIEHVDGLSVGAARALLVARSAAHAHVLGNDRPVRCAVDQTLCDDTALVPDGAELAFFPPLTGG